MHAKHTLAGAPIVALVFAAALSLPAQDEHASAKAVKFKNLFDFNGTNGAGPGSYGPPVVRGTDGNLYGAASYGAPMAA